MARLLASHCKSRARAATLQNASPRSARSLELSTSLPAYARATASYRALAAALYLPRGQRESCGRVPQTRRYTARVISIRVRADSGDASRSGHDDGGRCHRQVTREPAVVFPDKAAVADEAKAASKSLRQDLKESKMTKIHWSDTQRALAGSLLARIAAERAHAGHVMALVVRFMPQVFVQTSVRTRYEQSQSLTRRMRIRS